MSVPQMCMLSACQVGEVQWMRLLRVGWLGRFLLELGIREDVMNWIILSMRRRLPIHM